MSAARKQTMPEEIRQMCRGSVVAYATAMNPRYESAPHLVKIGRLLDRIAGGESVNATISLPRRHGKSMLCTENFPAYYLGRNPYNSIIASSYSQTLAERFGRIVGESMSKPLYREIFPEAALNPKGMTASEFRVELGGEYIATGAGGSITGRGAHVGIVDDPTKNQEEAESTLHRQRMKDWFHSTMESSIYPGGSLLLIATRWNDDDLIGYVNREVTTLKWENYVFPALDDNDKALWEAKFPTEWMHRKRESMPPKWWWSLYMQNPQIGDGGMIRRDKFWMYDPSQNIHFDYVIQSWDTAQQKGRRNDFSVCITWGIKDDKYYVIDIFMKRMEYPELRAKAEELIARFCPLTVVIENASSGQSLIQDLKATLKVQVEGVNVMKRGDDEDSSAGPRMDKDLVARVQRILPLIEAGCVMLPKGAPFVRPFLDECAAFDGSSSMHDDQVSAMSLFLNYILTVRFANPLSYRGYRGVRMSY